MDHLHHIKSCLELALTNPEKIGRIRDFVVALESLVHSLDTFKSWVKEVTARLRKQAANFLSESGEYDLKEGVRECQTKLKEAFSYSHNFIGRVESFYNKADLKPAQAQKIKDAIKSGKRGDLRSYIASLKNSLEQCSKRYKEFLEKFTEAKSMCDRVLRKCEEKKSEAKNRKITTRGVGVFGAGVLSVAGVGVLGVVGVVTAGVGPAVLCGVGAAVVGVTSYKVAQRFERLEASFRALCEGMDKLNTKVDTLGPNMLEIERMLLDHADEINSTEKISKGEEDSFFSAQEFDFFCGAFDYLLTGIESCKQKFRSHCKVE
jgi:hypothetical protein